MTQIQKDINRACELTGDNKKSLDRGFLHEGFIQNQYLESLSPGIKMAATRMINNID